MTNAEEETARASSTFELRHSFVIRHPSFVILSSREMKIQFTKKADGSAVFKCVRPDGSVTWQKQEGKHAAFFPLHDLTHYAVETELGFRRGFYGLIAEGWEIAETTG